MGADSASARSAKRGSERPCGRCAQDDKKKKGAVDAALNRRTVWASIPHG